jgi:hypothetical protein
MRIYCQAVLRLRLKKVNVLPFLYPSYLHQVMYGIVYRAKLRKKEKKRGNHEQKD